MQTYSLISQDEYDSFRSQRDGDERPKVVFVSVYEDENGARHLLFGCSPPNWDGFPALRGHGSENEESPNQRIHLKK